MREIFFSLIHDLGIPVILRRTIIKNKCISILMFHRVSDEYDPLWPPLPINSFRFLMKELSLNACVVRLEDIVNLNEYPDKPLVALSFDDGYADFLENALPILRDFNLPAHHNICPNLIDRGLPPWTQILSVFLQHNAGKSIELPNEEIYKIKNKFKESDFISICERLYALNNETRDTWINSQIKQAPAPKIPKLMNWGQIRECAKLGIHIGSHGMNHSNMSKIVDINVLLDEIRGSKNKIYKEVGIEPLIFAFPNGLYNSLSMQLVRESGYSIALLCNDMAALFPEGHREKFYVFSRINICRTNWKEEDLRLLGFHQMLKGWIKRLFFSRNQKTRSKKSAFR